MNYEKILEYCREKKISISAFEKLCGLTNGTVGKWNPERSAKRTSNPSLDSLMKMSKATGIPMTELISGGD